MWGVLMTKKKQSYAEQKGYIPAPGPMTYCYALGDGTTVNIVGASRSVMQVAEMLGTIRLFERGLLHKVVGGRR